MNQTLETVTSESIATTNKTIGPNSTLAEFTYNNTPSALRITPFFANKVITDLTVHSEHDLASARAHNFVTDLDEFYISNFGNT